METLTEEQKAENLRKAQKKFTKVGTNLKNEELAVLKKRVEELGLNYSSYVKKLILNDLENKVIEKYDAKTLEEFEKSKSKKLFGLF